MGPKFTMNCQNRDCTRRGNTDGVEIQLMKCSACKKVSYCSRECQVAHWKEHKPICKSLRDDQNLPDMDDVMSRIEELRPCIFGRHAPVAERITMWPLDGPDPDCAKARVFADNLDNLDVTRYAVEKFLATGDKGAVVFNIKYPYMDSPTYSRLFWIPRASWVESLSPLIVRQVTDYDPAHQAVIFFALPSADGLSIKVWCREALFTIDPAMRAQVAQVKRIWKRNMRVWEREGLLRPQT